MPPEAIVTPEQRQSTATEILRRTAALAGDIAAIEALKTALRGVALAQGSFTEHVAGLGRVEVKAAKKASFKGTMPTLVPELYLAMTEEERTALTASGVVVMAEQWSKPFSGAVTVTPA
jgi:hypothetical protein